MNCSANLLLLAHHFSIVLNGNVIVSRPIVLYIVAVSLKVSLYLCSIVSEIAIPWHPSLSTIGQKSYAFRKIRTLEINLAIGFIRKNLLECIG